jgi:alpha-L-rhamnosidase
MEEIAGSPQRLDAGEQSAARIVPCPAPTLRWWPPSAHPEVTGYDLQAIVDEGTTRRHRAVGPEPRTVWPWEPLPSRSTVRWRVRALDESGFSAWSDRSTFHTPLWHPDDWTARWISPDEPPSRSTGERAAQVVRKDFDLPAAPSSARLYATALGVYEVNVNGIRLDGAELAPGSSSYDTTLYAQP